MRIWSIHPCYLDTIGLVAAWREALLAQKVLAGKTFGYTRHPQLDRFHRNDGIQTILQDLLTESEVRGFHFASGAIEPRPAIKRAIAISTGQVAYEACFLRKKRFARNTEAKSLPIPEGPEEVRLSTPFTLVEGPVASWERQK